MHKMLSYIGNKYQGVMGFLLFFVLFGNFWSTNNGRLWLSHITRKVIEKFRGRDLTQWLGARTLESKQG